MRQVGAGKRIPTTTTPFLPWHPVGDLGAVQPVAPLAPHTPWVPTFCGAYFGASDRSSCWAAYTKIVRSGTSRKRRIFAVAYGC